jgi:hypothetical protein
MLTSATLHNVLNHRHLELPFTQANLIAGGNARGKTALIEALRYAIRGEVPRGITTKKDTPLVVTEGAKAGRVAIEAVDHDTGEVQAWTRTLDTKQALEGEVPAVLGTDFASVGLYADQFARMDSQARRRLLFAATGTKADLKAVGERLTKEKDPDGERLIPDTLIGQALPLLKTERGFETAAEAATERAKAERSNWRTITGETYGKDKAEGWTKTPPERPAGDLGALRAEVRTDEDRQRRVTALLELARRRAALGEVPDAKTVKARKAKLEADREQQAALRAERAQLVKDMATPARPPQEHACPHCGGALVLDAGGVRRPDDAAIEVARPDHAPRIAAIDQALQEYATTLSDEAAAIERLAYTRAQADALALEEQDDTPLAALEAEQVDLAANLAALNRRLTGLEQYEREVAAAEETTARAAHAHAAAQAWDRVATLFGPDGIPAELLARALGPFRTALQFAPDGCPAVTVDDAMTVRFGGRDYALCSESERWRADAICAAALARVAKAPLLLIDRFDVLEAEDRANWLDWLVALGGKGLQVIAAGTLKNPPDWEGLTVHWLGSRTTDPQQAAA